MNKSIPPKPNNNSQRQASRANTANKQTRPEASGAVSHNRAQAKNTSKASKTPQANLNRRSQGVNASKSTTQKQGGQVTQQNKRPINPSAKNRLKSLNAKKTTVNNKKPNILKRIANSFSAVPAGSSHKNDFIKPTDVLRIKGSYDTIFLVLVIILTLFGLVMDFSASYAYAFNRFGDSFYFLKHQAFFAGLGFIAMFLAMKFDYKWIRKLTVLAFVITIFLLIGVLLYGFAAGAAQRWITIGSVSFQPSEIAKLTLVLTLALYVARNQDRITNYRNAKQSNIYGMFIPFLIVAVICGLVAFEKHFSGTIIIFGIGMVIIFAAGARISWFIAGGTAAATAIGIAITTVPYAIERLNMFRFPERYGANDELWQTLQGLYAVGSGGLFGVGLGNSRQKHLYVSQPQNDFVFSIISEELGFAGALLVVILFMLLIWRGFSIALKAPDTFSSLVVIGLISKVAIQALLNIAVVTNLIPNTGISLPFFSYGGTALMMQLGEMGIILSISRFSYQKKDTLQA